VTTRALHRRLTSVDALFLYAEKPTQPMHVGGCLIYEGHVSRDELIRMLQQRMHLLPRYRQKVVFPPFGLAHPTWEDDPDFDIARHVDERTLPEPGDDRALSEAGGDAFAGMLDRDRPLWKLCLLQGRADGNTAAVWKIHHAMVDGVSGVDLTMVLHGLTPETSTPAEPASWQPAPLPDAIALLQSAVQDRLVEAAQFWTQEGFRLFRPAEASNRARQLTQSLSSSLPSLLKPVPRTPFNAPLSAERRFAWAELSFTEVRAIRAALGGTVNDVVLTVVAGGLGRYLRAHGHATEGVELRAMCPVSMRRPEERGALGNLVSIMLAPLHVGILDPVERLAAERGAMEALKRQDQAAGLYEMTQLLNSVPPLLQAIGGALTLPQTLLNTVSTNVPGPQIPLYLGPHKLVGWCPLIPLASDIGLCNAILSYNQRLTIGATVDPRLVPDPWFYAECLRESFAELLAASRSAGSGSAASASAASGSPASRGAVS